VGSPSSADQYCQACSLRIVSSHGVAVLRGCGCACTQVDADLWGTAKFVDSVRLPYIAPSLGGVDSLIEQPTVISYWDQARTCTPLLFTESLPQPLCPAGYL